MAILFRGLLAAAFCVALAAPAWCENYQTDIGPTPKNGQEGQRVMGRGSVLATLTGSQFILHGKFSGLAGPATDAQLRMGNVMGGTGPAIGALTISQNPSGDLTGSFTLSSDQIAALKAGKLYVLLNSTTAPKGNLWGWFQPAHVTVGPDVPQTGNWYIPNIIEQPPKGAGES